MASTRLILLEGDAGSVIKSFGTFVVGGNYVVGAVIFLILVIINFVVITKGAGRIAEVTARFTLDAMPGKQMSIDAEMNSGVITEAEALEKRARIQKDADFYGSMDGASKFVRGDAVAGIFITVVNIVGGILIGYFQRDLTMTEALQTYTILSIGDGLVTQIPAIVVSIAAGILVTRSSGGIGPRRIRRASIDGLSQGRGDLWRDAPAFRFLPQRDFLAFLSSVDGLLCRRLSFSQESGCGNILRAAWRCRFGPPRWRQSIQSRSRFRRSPR